MFNGQRNVELLCRSQGCHDKSTDLAACPPSTLNWLSLYQAIIIAFTFIIIISSLNDQRHKRSTTGFTYYQPPPLSHQNCWNLSQAVRSHRVLAALIITGPFFFPYILLVITGPNKLLCHASFTPPAAFANTPIESCNVWNTIMVNIATHSNTLCCIKFYNVSET